MVEIPSFRHQLMNDLNFSLPSASNRSDPESIIVICYGICSGALFT
ncbi:hypothetical protein ACT9XH_07785 [Methanococcoides methylutens]